MPMMQVNGARLHYHLQGKGTPIVLIHPPFVASQIFNYWKYQLSEHYKVIVFDIRGHGLSEASDVPLSFPLIVEDMMQLLDQLGIKKAIVGGYSVGGSVAIEALLTHPDRFIGGILVSTMPELSDWTSRVKMHAGALASSMKAKELLAFTLAWGNADSSNTFYNLHKEALSGSPKQWEYYAKYSLYYSCIHKLSSIKAPMLLFYGEKDRNLLKHAKQLCESLQDNELYIVTGLSYQIPTKAADRVSELIHNWAVRRLDTHSEKVWIDTMVYSQTEALQDGIVPEQLMH